MSRPSQLSLGHRVPDKSHAVSVHFPKWLDVCDFGLGSARVHSVLKHGYPRTVYLEDLVNACTRNGPSPSEGLGLFPDYQTAVECKSFITSQSMHKEEAVDPACVSLFAVDFDKRNGGFCTELIAPATLYAVIHPIQAERLKMTFWRLTGRGISSRQAGQCLDRGCRFSMISGPKPGQFSAHREPPVYESLRAEIAALLERSPINPHRVAKVSSADVYMHPSGMSAIYHVHQALVSWRSSDIIILGFPYELSIKMVQTLGLPYQCFSFGTDEEIDKLEDLLKTKAERGEKIQAVWCEAPNNPVLRTVDMNRVRRLADLYDFIFVVDDTIGTAANIDVQDVADVIVTSLSKSFSGGADVLAGSVVLNPHFSHFQELKLGFNATYTNNLYVDDAEQLKQNHGRYLHNLSQQNDTASYLANLLHQCTFDPHSAVAEVLYPEVCWSRNNYLARMRPPTDEFVSGFGGVLAVTFHGVAAASAFFDNLDLYKGPSFGANVSIALPYVQLVLQKDKEWAASQGLDETLVRISAGMEDKEDLLARIKKALQAANATVQRDCLT